jgi:hypothetical protein
MRHANNTRRILYALAACRACDAPGVTLRSRQKPHFLLAESELMSEKSAAGDFSPSTRGHVES